MNARFFKLLASAALALSLTACSNTTETPKEEAPKAEELVRATEYGKVKGVEENGVEAYYGIPYGKEPVGDLRWKAPQDPDKWDDVKDATQKEEVAMQSTSTTNEKGETVVEATGSTDCLNLDVYTTEDAKDKPVLVYIHGGNNQTGSSFEIPGFDMVETDDLVYVSVNYRLGLLGFNNLPALLDDENNTGNFTMLDLAKALAWVKDNIANFGGDPNNVTVSGFSAGGRDVMAMLVSPTFEGLFDKAIAFSGGMTIAEEDASIQKIAETIAPLVVEDKEADNEEEAAKWLMSDDEKVRDYLYSIDSERLVKLFPNAGIRMAKFPHLYNDGVVIPKEGFDSDYVNDVPVMMVTGSEEFTMFGGFDPSIEKMKDPDAARAFIAQYGGDFYR
ncbi:carboxylesterase family protein, partial [uncultured Dubosiella sp.]